MLILNHNLLSADSKVSPLPGVEHISMLDKLIFIFSYDISLARESIVERWLKRGGEIVPTSYFLNIFL